MASLFRKVSKDPIKEIEFMPYEPLTPELAEEIKEQLPVKPDYLILLCEAIKEYEGWFPNSRSFRNNSPGNCRYSPVGYLPKYGEVKRDPQNFAIFKDYETGWLYLKNLILSKASRNPSWNLVSFFKEYAPEADHNDPVRYTTWVGKKMGVNPFLFQLKELTIKE